MKTTKKDIVRYFSIVFGLAEVKITIYCLAAYFTAFAIVGMFYLRGLFGVGSV